MHTWLSGENQSVSTGLNKSTSSKHLKTVCLAVVGAHGRVTLCCESQGDDSVATPLPEIGDCPGLVSSGGMMGPGEVRAVGPLSTPHPHEAPPRAPGDECAPVRPTGWPGNVSTSSLNEGGRRGPLPTDPQACYLHRRSCLAVFCRREERQCLFPRGEAAQVAGEGAMPSPPFAGAAGRPRPAARTLGSDSQLSDGAEQFGGGSR